MNVELRHLRYFTAVAEEATFTGAARRVHVAQQVLSTQIRQLEQIVGTRLLYRGSRGVTLTPAGEAFLTAARDTLTRLDRGLTAARNAAATVSGRLAIGLSGAAGAEIRTMVISAFGQAYPQAQVSLHSFDLTRPAAGLLDGSTDVALVRPPVDAPGIILREIWREPRVFILPAAHPLAGRASLTLADVAGLPWVAAAPATDGCRPATWRDDFLASPRPGGDVPVIGATATTIEEWREYIVAGKGISLCPASAQRFGARPGIAFVPAKDAPPAHMSVAWRADDNRDIVRAFTELAATTAQDA